jgi:hypothetical protein
MKKFLFFIFISYSLFLSANENMDNWKYYWIKAIEACNDAEYIEAENNFSIAINLMEQSNDSEHPNIYVDHARLYLLLKKYHESLDRIEVALNSNKLSEKEKLRAIITRIAAKSQLGISEGILEDVKFIGENYSPKIESTEKKIIIRDVPKCECYQKIMTCYYIHSGICNSKNDIKILNSGIWTINKTNENTCGSCQSSEKVCDACGQTITQVDKKVDNNVEKCKAWCDANTIVATAWCTKTFKTPACQAACILAVYTIQKGCHCCCSNGDFYEKCIKPFGYITDYIKEPCDPLWD